MRILYIDHYAGSLTYGMEYRPYYLARQWVEAGHQVRIVGASFAHVRQRQPEVLGPRAEEVDAGIEFLWLRTPAYEGNGLGRVRNMLTFVWHLTRLRRELAQWAPDIVIASSTYPWDIYPARAIARRASAKLVFEVHDLWPLSPMELGGMSARHPFIMSLQHAEDYACRHADKVVSILPHTDRHLVTRGLDPARFHHVPNGIDLAEWTQDAPELPADTAAQLAGFRRSHPFLVGYVGGHGPANDLQPLIDAAARVQDAGVGVVLVGSGSLKASLKQAAAATGASNLLFLDAIPKRTVPTMLRAMDALYIGMTPLPLYRFGISPNKIMDYMAAARPIIQAIESPTDLVGAADCGVSVRPHDIDAIARAMRDLSAMPPERLRAMGERGREYVSRHHDYRVLASEFLAVLAR